VSLFLLGGGDVHEGANRATAVVHRLTAQSAAVPAQFRSSFGSKWRSKQREGGRKQEPGASWCVRPVCLPACLGFRCGD
jgi:hypothetical protein